METNDALDPLDDTERRIGRNLRRIRENLGLKQQDVADRLAALGFRFHQTQVAKVERGERPVRVNEWIAIAEALGVQADVLMAGGLGTDDKLFEARLIYERSRMELDSAGMQLYEAEGKYDEAWRYYRDAKEQYFAVAQEFGEEPDHPERMIAEEVVELQVEREALSAVLVPLKASAVLQGFGYYMEMIRLRAGLTHQELSRKTAVPVSTIRDLEKGRFLKIGNGHARVRSVIRMLAAACGADATAASDTYGELIENLEHSAEGKEGD